MYASSIVSSFRIYSLKSACVTIKSIKILTYESVYILSEVVVNQTNDFVCFLLIYIFNQENNFYLFVNESLVETDSYLFSAEIVFQEKPCSQEPACRTQNANPLPNPQMRTKHTEQGPSGVAEKA